MSEQTFASGVFSERARDALRRKERDALGNTYNPWLHLLGPSAIAMLVAIASLVSIQSASRVDWREWLVIPGTWLLANAAEWRIHRDLLHRKSPLFPWLYERHTLMHHHVFVQWDLDVRHRREWGLVLIPPAAVLLICAATLPIALLVALLGQGDSARLFLATAITYVVSYEWLHLSYHLPQDSLVGRNPLIRWLRRHHATHHHPAHMGVANFNVTLPLWDLLRRTRIQPMPEPSAGDPEAATTSS